MNHHTPFLLWPLVLALAAGGAFAQSTLTPPSGRISDAAITADHKTYEALQARIKALNDRGRPLRDAHLAAAQCWLDTSFHEYSRNDRGPWPQAALAESEGLLKAMESAATLPALQVPLVAGAERVRPDLWQRSAALRSHAGWSCAAARAACAEVELVHAGHEQAQLGWRHARPYLQIAEDLVGEAEAQAQSCSAASPMADAPRRAPPVVVPGSTTSTTATSSTTGSAAGPTGAPPAGTVTPPPGTGAAAAVAAAATDPTRVILFGQVVFRFDGDSATDVPRGGWVSIQALLQKLREDKLQLQTVYLGGHADRIVSNGKPEYNQQLSQRRAEAVRAHLLQQGIPADRIRIESFGSGQPREACQAPLPKGLSLVECLLPNRRVEIVVDTRKP